MNKMYEILIIVGIVVIMIGLGIAYGFSKDEMTLGDDWRCGYVNMTATLLLTSLYIHIIYI